MIEAEVVEYAELENIFGKDKADNHRQGGHYNTVYKIDGLEVGDEVNASGNAGADEEEHKTELTENIKGVFGHMHVDRSEMSEVTVYKADDKRAPRRAEGKVDSGNFDCSENNAQRHGGHKGEEIKRIELFKLFLGLRGLQRRWLL